MATLWHVSRLSVCSSRLHLSVCLFEGFNLKKKINNTMIFSLFHSAFALQSAGGEWNGTCKEGALPVSPPILLSHLIMWNNFSRCPALISLCGNSSLVPNCGARRTQPEHTAEQKGNNWSLPCPAHRFILTFIIIIMCFTEGDCMISFRHFVSAAPLFEPSH